MKISIFQKLVPFTNKKRTVDSFVCWQVRWMSRHGEYYFEVSPQIESFPIQKDAIDFKESLENAFDLLKYTGCATKVTIEKVES